MEDNCDICCICGCEDNEDLDDLVPCSCEASEALVHTSCAAACTIAPSPKFSSLGSTMLCIICGRVPGIMQNGGPGRCQDDGKGARGSKRSMSSTQVAGVEAKRQRTSSPDSVMEVETLPKIIKRESNMPRVEMESKDADCSKMGPARHGWRSADVPAVVPFKKRRIQIVEVPRSPSPPPKHNFPKVVPFSSPRMSTSVKPAALLLKSLSPKNDCCPLNSPSLNATSLLPGSASPASLRASKAMSPIPKFHSPHRMSPVSKSPSTKVTPELSYSSPSQPRPSSPQQTCPSLRLSPKPTFLPPKLSTRSSCSSPSHCPKRLPVETSEQSGNSSLKALEQGLRSQLPWTCCEGFHHSDALTVIRESHVSHLQSSRCFANQNQPSSSQEVEDGELVISTDKDLVDFEAAGELPEVCSQEARGQYSQFARSYPQGFHNDRSGWDLNTDMDTWDKLSNNLAHARKRILKCSRTVCETIKRNTHVTRQIVAANEALEYSSSKLLKGDVDIGKHDERNSELLELSKDALLQHNEELGKMEIRDDPRRIENSASWKEGEVQGLQRYRYATKLEDQASSLREEWNELAEDPEDEDHIDYGDLDCQDGDRSLMLEDEAYWRVEDTMDYASFGENKTISDGGRSKRKHGHLIEPCTEKCSTSGRVKSSGWDQLPEGFDSAEEALKATQVILSRRGRGYWANSGGRGSPQGSLSGNQHNSRRDEFRDSSRYGDRCVDEPSHRRENYNHTRRLDNDLDDYNSVWGRGGLRRGGAGVHCRGRFNSWSDNQQSSSLGEWGPRQLRSSSGFSSQGAAAVAAARVESSGFVVAPDGTISRGGRPSRVLQSTFENSHGARGRHSNRQAPQTDLDTGPIRPSRMDRHMGRNIGTDVGARQGAMPRYAGSMSERGVLPGCGNVDRYGKSSYSGRSGVLRRSESPHGLHISDHSYMGRRTVSLRPESRVTRSRLSSPSWEPYGLSKTFPGQRSSPPFPKWSHDRREADNFREREFKRLVPRSYGSSGRTSPHVVHGSSLMDERDWRVLAGTRSSPGARRGLNSSVHSGKSMDGSAELHRLRQAEEEERTHSIPKDSDHSRNSPKEVDRVRGSAFKKDGSRDDDKKRESYRLFSGCQRAGSRDGDNDLQPRRHRSSW